MPWLATSHDGAPGGAAGVIGKFWWFRPDAEEDGVFNEVPLPSNVVAIDSQISWAGYQGAAYGAGGWTDNVVFTGDFQLWSLGIEPPTVVPTVALAAGPGITAEVICYLRFRDEVTGERSPLSAPSATLSASNQSIAWTSLTSATSLNPRVTHIEGWRSVDGSLPRLVWSREIGVTSVTEAVAAGSLGEAYAEDYDKFPRCRYNAIWHERLVMAGDDQHPDTIYFSLIGQPEQRSSVSLRTKSGQSVIGLVVIRDTLIVLCPYASEIVSGYTEDDIQIQIAQPRIGAVSHWAIQVIHGLGFIWSDLGLYLCDGSSWFYLSNDIQTVYARDYQERRADYEGSWSAHDPASYAAFLYVKDMTLSPFGKNDRVPVPSAAWTIDYNAVTPQQGGNFSQPNWSLDVYPEADDNNLHMRCSAVLSVPGGRRGDAFFGNSSGRILRYLKQGALMSDVSEGAERNLSFGIYVEHGADAFGDFGGDTTHGKRFTEIDVFLESEKTPWRLEVLGGDEWIGEQGTRQPNQDLQFGAWVEASEDQQGDSFKERRTVHSFKMPSVTGRRVVVRFGATFDATESGTGPPQLEYYGYQIYWMPGTSHRKALDEQV